MIARFINARKEADEYKEKYEEEVKERKAFEKILKESKEKVSKLTESVAKLKDKIEKGKAESEEQLKLFKEHLEEELVRAREEEYERTKVKWAEFYEVKIEEAVTLALEKQELEFDGEREGWSQKLESLCQEIEQLKARVIESTPHPFHEGQPLYDYMEFLHENRAKFPETISPLLESIADYRKVFQEIGDSISTSKLIDVLERIGRHFFLTLGEMGYLPEQVEEVGMKWTAALNHDLGNLGTTLVLKFPGIAADYDKEFMSGSGKGGIVVGIDGWAVFERDKVAVKARVELG